MLMFLNIFRDGPCFFHDPRYHPQLKLLRMRCRNFLFILRLTRGTAGKPTFPPLRLRTRTLDFPAPECWTGLPVHRMLSAGDIPLC